MEVAEQAPDSRPGRPVYWSLVPYIQDVALVCIFALFATAQIRTAFGGDLHNVPFAIENSLLLVLFLTRRRSAETSARPADWAVAAVASWLPLAYLAQGGVAVTQAYLGTAIQLVGLGMAVAAFGFLGRSIGIVAADRGLKTGGIYRVVRHPAYAAHVTTGAGFLIANPHWINATIWATAFACQIARIHAEERLLRRRTQYAVYADAVRWRLLPGVY
jgi:protein-S-isoprenylcysteine O-methyltransferase Ste14